MSPVLGRRVVFVVCRWTAGEPDLTRRLSCTYRPWFGDTCAVRVRRLPEARLAVALVGEPEALPDEVPDVFAWGTAVGAAGAASVAELTAVAERPAAAGALLGSFVVVRTGPEAVRLVVSADLVHVVRHVAGQDGEAWSGHGVAAAVASGRPLAVRREPVPELLLTDYVWADDELVDGVTVLREATTVDVGPEGATSSEWWTAADRLMARDDVAPTELRAVVCATLEQLLRVGELELALTAGRDSTLLAGCLAELGSPVPAFTMGGAADPDVLGAAAVAQHLGWTHRTVLPPADPTTSVERLLRTTRWTEGLDTAWNAIGAPLRWHRTRPTHLYGIGGEMGRAFYWGRLPDPHRDAEAVMVAGAAESLGAQAEAVLRSRAQLFAGQLRERGWTGTGVLDGWHAHGRVRKWPMRTPPPADVRTLLTAYPSPRLAGALLGMPATARQDASGFDEAARLGGDLHALAAAARRPAAPRRRVPGQRWRARRRDVSVRLARDVQRELGLAQSPVDDVLGRRQREDLGRAVGAAEHRWRWNALAVDALEVDLATLRAEPDVRAWRRADDPVPR